MTTVSPPTPAESFAALAVGMYEFAQYIVAEILTFQPDLVIGLAHSGVFQFSSVLSLRCGKAAQCRTVRVLRSSVRVCSGWR